MQWFAKKLDIQKMNFCWFLWKYEIWSIFIIQND